MSRRFVLALLALALLCAGGALLAQGLRPAPAEVRLAGAPVLPGLRDRLAEVARVRVETADGGYVLARDGDDWVAASEHAYPAKAARVNRLLVGLANLETIEAKTADPDRFARLSVGDPAADPLARRVTLEARDGTVLARLIVGRQRHGLTGRADAGTYVRRPDGPRAWLAAGLVDLSDGVYPWLDTFVIDLAPGELHRIEIRHADGGGLTAVRPARGAPALALAGVPSGRTPDVAAVRKLGALLSQIKFDAVEPADRFVPEQRIARTRVRSFDGLVVTVDVLRRDGRFWLELAASAADAGAEARADALNARVDGWVYQVADYVARRLTRKLDDVLVAPGAE